MIMMKVPVQQAEAILSNIPGSRFEKGKENYWKPDLVMRKASAGYFAGQGRGK